MGVSEEGGIGVECTVGTIVWVRRRNGSWWPGKILGQEELSASHLMSPRSGTPVKLLGREDASVDWYNLEKSKRVKAFRCGEFDGCIERAAASQGIPIKKREKYARREDAILHALELEKKQIQLKQQKLGVHSISACDERPGTNDRTSNSSLKTDLYIKSDDYQKNSKSMNDKSEMISRKGSSPDNGENMIDSSYVQRGNNIIPTIMEDSTAAVPRMRGLQDFGLRIDSSKQNLSHSLASVISVAADDNHVTVASDARPSIGRGKNFLASRKRRSLSGMTEESLAKRRDRRRPLMKVLQNSDKLLDSIPHQRDVGVGFSMDGENDNVGTVFRAKRSHCVYLPVDSGNMLDHVPFAVDECKINSSGEGFTSAELLESDEIDASEIDFLVPNLKEDESMLEGLNFPEKDTKHDPPADQVIENYEYLSDTEYTANGAAQFDSRQPGPEKSAELRVSKWHIKGKRKIRNLGRRPLDPMNQENHSIVDHKISISAQETSLGNSDDSCFKMDISPPSGQREQIFCPKELLTALCSQEDLDNDTGQPLVSDNNQYGLRFGYLEGSHSNQNDSENDSHFVASADGRTFIGQRALRIDSEESPGPASIDCPSSEILRGFIDVDLKVQAATYHGEHVPLVSLMSRLNGKAIIGHPIQIEIMEDGSTCSLVPPGSSFTDQNAASPPVWSTGRRTAMQRVPRSNPGPAAMESPEDEEALGYDDPNMFSGFSGRQAPRKNSRVLRTPSGRFQKKPPKKGNLSNQKTRTLSSIGTRNMNGGENGDTKPRGHKVLRGLMESRCVVPLVTCVPMKVVFSRIMEAIARPSSMARRSRTVP